MKWYVKRVSNGLASISTIADLFEIRSARPLKRCFNSFLQASSTSSGMSSMSNRQSRQNLRMFSFSCLIRCRCFSWASESEDRFTSGFSSSSFTFDINGYEMLFSLSSILLKFHFLLGINVKLLVLCKLVLRTSVGQNPAPVRNSQDFPGLLLVFV